MNAFKEKNNCTFDFKKLKKQQQDSRDIEIEVGLK